MNIPRVRHILGGLWHRIARQPVGAQAALLFVALFFVYAATAAYGKHQDTDTVSTALTAWQLVMHGNVHLDAFIAAGNHPEALLARHVGNHYVPSRMPGPIFLAVPFYFFAGHGAGVTLLPAALAAVTVTAAAMAFLYVLLRQLVSPRVALVATGIAALATPTWSVSADAIWPQGPDQLFIVLGLLLFSLRHRVASGISFAAAFLSRPHTAVIAVTLGVFTALKERTLRPVVAMAPGGIIGLALLLAYNRWVFGHGNLNGGYPVNADGPGHWSLARYLINWAGAFVSPERGLLVLSPFLLLLVPGLTRAWKEAPHWARTAAVGGVTYTALQLWHDRFTGGDGFFGYRVTLELLTAAAPLLVLAYTTWTNQASWRRRMFWTLCALSFVSQIYGARFYPPIIGLHSPWTTYMPWWGLRSLSFMSLLATTSVAVLVGALLHHRFTVERRPARRITPAHGGTSEASPAWSTGQ